jgi:hypothetical protein
MSAGFAIFAGGVLCVVICCVTIARQQRRNFARKFPPISDAEFLALCSPGTRPEAALKVRRVISDTPGVEYERVYPSGRFIEDYGCD